MANKHYGLCDDLNESKQIKKNVISVKFVKIEPVDSLLTNDVKNKTQYMLESDPYEVKVKEETEDSMICDETYLPDSKIKIEVIENDLEKECIDEIEKGLNYDSVKPITKDVENTSFQSFEEVLIKEEKRTVLIEEEHLLKYAEETSHESLENGELSSCQNHLSFQEKFVHANEKKFRCDECGNMFARKCDLFSHLRIHSCIKPFKCDICKKLFSQKAHLNSHMLTHTNERPHKCNICNKTFKQNSHLAQHKSFHSEDKQHLCDRCDKQFVQKIDLIKHKQVHSNNSLINSHMKSFKCDICEKLYSRKSFLKRHMFTHTGERRYECDTCDKTFDRIDSLARHKLIHSGVRHFCDQCDKQFVQKNDLARHKRVHSGEKPYKCDVCGKGFTDHSSRIAHRRVHTGERPFSCNICNRFFTLKSTLNKHILKIHKNFEKKKQKLRSLGEKVVK